MQDQQQQVDLVGTTPIQALPPAAAIDLDVLDALPLHLKRELERAYGAVEDSFRYLPLQAQSMPPLIVACLCPFPRMESRIADKPFSQFFKSG